MRPLMLKVKSSENCPEKGLILAVFGARWGQRIGSFDLYCKRHIYTWIHVV